MKGGLLIHYKIGSKTMDIRTRVNFKLMNSLAYPLFCLTVMVLIFNCAITEQPASATEMDVSNIYHALEIQTLSGMGASKFHIPCLVVRESTLWKAKK
jgi:hypothetical protein